MARRLPQALFNILVLLAYLFMLAPVVAVVVISFFDDQIIQFPPSGLTLRWFGNAWARSEFTAGLIESLKLALTATAIGVPAGAAAAYAIHRGRFHGRKALSTLLLGPLAVPSIIMGTALYIFYINAEFVLDRNIVGTSAGLIAAHILLTIPWTVRLVLASMEGLDPSIEEAARNLGAPPLVVFWRVTLPMLKSGIIAGGMFSFIQSFENLELSLLLIGPGKITLPVAMLNYLEFKIDPTLAAVGTLQIILIAVLMLVTDRYVKIARAF
ncbi:ABC transporter permease [Ketogulonicigenium vulgare]|uniref:ABC transporter permease n=1 Tax=Ketogulonicigenium vulgare TaxID=92945 RepID=UPI0023589E2D|nr:ABC transporter permease [Ketogulonicigenium vulgare]